MTEQVSHDVFHKPIREALREIIRYSIEHGSDPDFIAEVIETNGFRLWSRTQPWRKMRALVADGAAGRLFPEGSADAEAFDRIYDIEGGTEAMKWLSSRFKFCLEEKRRDGSTWRVRYVPVRSDLERQIAKAPRRTKRERLTLLEGK